MLHADEHAAHIRSDHAIEIVERALMERSHGVPLDPGVVEGDVEAISL
jgi:hypothetical protein